MAAKRRSVVVIPTYNERENIEKLLEEIFRLPLEIGILIVDDNSPDGTGELVEELRARWEGLSVIHRRERLGLGTAYISGFKAALAGDAQLILTMDADFSHDPRYIPKLIEEADRADVVIGSRYIPGGEIRNWQLYRRVLSRGANRLARSMLGFQACDVTSGYRCYRRRVLESIKLDTIFSQGYSCLAELLYRAQLHGFKVSEVPITFVDRKYGSTKISKREIFRGACTLLRLRMRRCNIKAKET